jgi:ABC-2 type transport system permease protein
MSAAVMTLRDCATMLRRNLLHIVRYPSLTLLVLGQPLLFLLLFVYVFGGTMGAGLPAGDGRSDYLQYVTPTIVILTVAAVGASTSILIAKDAGEGIVDRFKTMPIARASVLTGHVLAALVQTLLGVAALFLLALVLGYRPDASAGWLVAALGFVLLLGIAVTWLCVALGLAAGSVEAASNTPMLLILLPFISSGFVPTDSMPTWLGWVADHQPFTPIIETLRDLLDGRGPGAGADRWWALSWCVLIAVVCFWWAGRLFGRVRAS